MNINKQGVFNSDLFNEYYQANDGAIFLKLLYHNTNGGKTLFTSTNADNCQEKDLYSKLYLLRDNEELFKNNNTYEFIFLQAERPNTIYRWKQTSNPMISTTLSGFANVSNMTSNLALIKYGTQAAMCASNCGWWMAIGSWTAYQGGVPGIPQAVVKTWMELYARINLEQVKFYKTNEILAKNFNEI